METQTGERVGRVREIWETGAHDVLVVGHTHQLFTERLGGTLVINPGSTQFNHSCAILSLPDLEVRIFSLSNQAPLKSWNWGAHPGPRRRPAGR